MKMGSIAIALVAEYGDVWPAAISLMGNSCTNPRPASRAQAANGMRSRISPIPQLRDEGIENSGSSSPAVRPVGTVRVMASRVSLDRLSQRDGQFRGQSPQV